VSFVETGRAKLSREMVLRLGDALEMPLRARNALLGAAGYAACYVETDLDAPVMQPVRDAVGLILAHQEPYPAFLLDRHWNIRRTNRAAERCTRFLLGREPDDANMIRLVLSPDGLRPALVNWKETAADLVRHLQEQVAATPDDAKADDLLREVLEFPDVSGILREHDADIGGTPLLTNVFRRDAVELRFFSTLTTFGTPRDVALDELRIECSFPGDTSTAEHCARLFA
jgi:hypothetical protein